MSYVTPQVARSLAQHELREITPPAADVRAFYLRNPKEGRIGSALILFHAEGITICGDYCPRLHGVTSTLGYGIGWFAGELAEGYLCEKFLERGWQAEAAAEWCDDQAKEITPPVRPTDADRLVDWHNLATELRAGDMGPERFHQALEDLPYEVDELPGRDYPRQDAAILCGIQQAFRREMLKAAAEVERRAEEERQRAASRREHIVLETPRLPETVARALAFEPRALGELVRDAAFAAEGHKSGPDYRWEALSDRARRSYTAEGEAVLAEVKKRLAEVLGPRKESLYDTRKGTLVDTGALPARGGPGVPLVNAATGNAVAFRELHVEERATLTTRAIRDELRVIQGGLGGLDHLPGADRALVAATRLTALCVEAERRAPDVDLYALLEEARVWIMTVSSERTTADIVTPAVEIGRSPLPPTLVGWTERRVRLLERLDAALQRRPS